MMNTKTHHFSRNINGFQELLGALMVVGVILVLPLAGIGIVISGIAKGIRNLLCEKTTQ